MLLKNSQYNFILQEYDNRRRKARLSLDRRIAGIYDIIPEIRELDDEIVSGSVSTAKMALEGDYSGLKGLSERNMALGEKKKELLRKNGYPMNYLELEFVCKDCKDTGYIGSEKCHCFKQAIISLVYDQSTIREVLERENFTTFNIDLFSDDPENADPILRKTPRKNMKEVVDEAWKFIENFDHEFKNLLVYGETGVGKTFLLNCIAKELLDRSHSVLYFTAYRFYELLEKIKFSRGEADDEDRNRLSQIYDCDLLILDDLGTEMTNNFTVSQLYTVVNERELRRKSTIISTNFALKQLEAVYNERIFSRLSQNYTFIKVIGEDIRTSGALD